MIDVVNLQRKIKIDTDEIRAYAQSLILNVTDVGERTFSIAFISDTRMKQLNEMFRGKDSTADVLSFPHDADEFDPDKNNLGDVVISAEQAERQAVENGLTLEAEIKQLILHGVLHLCGYDHETDSGEMNSRELKLRKQLGI